MSIKKQKFSTLLLFMLVTVAALGFMISDAQAYQLYSQDQNDVGNCAHCHGEFRKGTYISMAEGFTWAGHLHQVHLDNTSIEAISCDNCHGDGTVIYEIKRRFLIF